MKKILTSESVNIGHPDKTCDTIADAFLDEALRQDPNSQMAVECAIKDDLLMIYGEATTKAEIDYSKIANEILKEVGYTKPFRIIQEISKQSPDINRAVVQDELRANDQGMVYGYASNETPEYMPMPIIVAHKLMRRYEQFRKSAASGGDFFSDAKSQVSIEYDKSEKPKAINTILISASHKEHLTKEQIHDVIYNHVISPVLTECAGFVTKETRFIVNPSGKFTIWGSYGDSGCVGRKIVVDTYGGIGRVGGGCFSSKNPSSKVDRGAAYYARFCAKNIVAHGFADKCEIQLSYGIGLAEPISVNIECFGTNKKPMAEIEKFVFDNFNFRPAVMAKELELSKPIFKSTACYGHFGREEFPWEKIKETT